MTRARAHSNVGKRKNLKSGYPSTPMQIKFCQEFVKCQNVTKAAEIAGYSSTHRHTLYTRMKRWAPYIQELQSKKNELVIKRHVVDQDDILESWASVINHDPLDYVEVVKEKVGSKVKLVERFKPLRELTAAQRHVIENIFKREDGSVGYTLRSRDKSTDNYAKHLGMLHDKLIQEHRHAHLHTTMDLSKLSDEQLEAAQNELVKILGPQAVRILGVAPEVYDAGEIQRDQEIIASQESADQ